MTAKASAPRTAKKPLLHPEGPQTLKESDLPGLRGQEQQTVSETLSLAHQAGHFMQNPAAQEAIRRLRLNCHNAFGRCDAQNVAVMQELRRTLVVVDAFETILQQMLDDGAKVKDDIKYTEKLKEQGDKRH